MECVGDPCAGTPPGGDDNYTAYADQLLASINPSWGDSADPTVDDSQDPTSGGSQGDSGGDVSANDSGATPPSDGSQANSDNNANQEQQTDFGQVQCTNADCTSATQTVTVTETDPALSPETTAILSKTNSLAEGPMNWMSVVFVVEAGVIVGVEAGPAAGEALETINPAVENSVGWTNVYQFVSGMANLNRAPLTLPALAGNIVGRIFKSLIP